MQITCYSKLICLVKIEAFLTFINNHGIFSSNHLAFFTISSSVFIIFPLNGTDIFSLVIYLMYAMPRLIILMSLYILFICLSHLPKKKLDLKSNAPARCSPRLNKRTEPDDSDDDFMDPPVPESK